MHSIVFAWRYAAGRKATIALAMLLFAATVVIFLSIASPAVRVAVRAIGQAFSAHPGPLGIIFSRWTLFDV
jgi:hypothetical protein